MPGLIAEAMFGLVALLLAGTLVATPIFLLVMAAQARVLGRPTLPPPA